MKTNKKFLSKKKKLMLAGALLFCCGLATSITATYAWYSIIESGYVKDLNMIVSSDLDIKLGIVKDGEIDYTNSHYTKEDFGYDEFYLDEVSGMFQEKWYKSGIDYKTALPEFSAPYRYTTSYTYTSPAKIDAYLQCEFYLLSNVDCAIMLGEDSSFVPNEQSNAIVARESGRNVEDLNAVKDATRVSFFFEDKYVIAKNSSTDPVTSYGGLLDLNNDGYYDYDPITNREILYGEYEGTPTYYTPSVEEDIVDYGEDKGVFTANHRPGVERVDLSSVKIIEENAVPIKDLMFIESEMTGQRIEPLLELEANKEKRIVITTYLEGWDKKMTDLLTLASLDVNISFVPLFNYHK